MYYNLTEDQKAFYETSYSLLKAGYTNEEIVEFWSNDNEEEVEFILESLEYVDINRKDPDFIEFNEGWAALGRIGARLIAPVTNAVKGVRTARALSQLTKLGRLPKPSIAQRRTILRLQKELGDKAKGIKINYKQVPKDELAKIGGSDDVLQSVRPGQSSGRRGNASQIQPTPASTPASTPATPPKTPVAAKPPKPPKTTTSKVGDALAYTVAGGGVAAGLISNLGKNTKDDPTPEVKPTETKVEPEVKTPKVKPQKTDPDKKADQDNFTSDGTEIKIGDEVGGSDMQPAPETTVPKTPKTQVTPEVKPPSRKKPRFSFGTYDRSGQSRRGTTGGVNNSYEYAIDKLISEGHASSIEEAEYVFKQLDDDFIKALIS